MASQRLCCDARYGLALWRLQVRVPASRVIERIRTAIAGSSAEDEDAHDKKAKKKAKTDVEDPQRHGKKRSAEPLPAFKGKNRERSWDD